MTFLLGCLRRYFSRAESGYAPLTSDSEIDWTALLDMARWHAVIPHLHHSLRASHSQSISSDGPAELQALFEANTQHNLHLTGTLRAILRSFDAHGISALPYKGPALAMRLYDNITLRQFGDLDILVRPQDAPLAIALLRRQGYQPLSPSGIRTMFLDRFRKVHELQHPDSQVCVELHWALTSWTFYFPLDLAFVWHRLEMVSMADTPVRAMGIEDTLLMLGVHGAKHQWGRLSWLCDVAALLGRYTQLDWPALLKQADELGGTRMLLLGLQLAACALRIPLPPVVEHRMQSDPAVDRLAVHVQSRLLTNQALTAEAVDDPAFYLGLRARRQDRMRCRLYLAYHHLLSRLK